MPGWQPPPQVPPQARQAPAPAKIGPGRPNVVLAIGMLAFFTVAVVICVRGALDAENTESSILVWFFAALFTAALVMVLIGLPRMLAPRYVLVNPAGLGIQHGRRIATGVSSVHLFPHVRKQTHKIYSTVEVVAAGEGVAVAGASRRRRLAAASSLT